MTKDISLWKNAPLWNKSSIKIATKKDWETEYLSPKISVKNVSGVEEAIKHINKYGSSHTDSIVTKNKKTAKKNTRRNHTEWGDACGARAPLTCIF